MLRHVVYASLLHFGVETANVLTKCRAKFSGAVGSAWCQGKIKQLDYDGFGESPLLVKPVASLP